MFSISYKAKQFLLVIIKLLIVSIAMIYLYYEIKDKKIIWSTVFNALSFESILLLVAFSTINWLLEIAKWRNLVSNFKSISFLEAAQQCLGSLTVSIFTPNRIGEYGAKALYYSKEETKKIIFLNFISNSSQMAITCFFGLLGLLLFKISYTETMVWFAFKIKILPVLIATIVFACALLIAFRFKKSKIYGISIATLFSKVTSFPRIILKKTFLFSLLRFLVFSHQFYYLLYLLNCDISYLTALSCIFTMYFLASIIPSIHLLDVAIKSSVAVYLFAKFGVLEWKIIMITSLMWIFNLFFPVLLGSYFVFQFKFQKK